MSFDIKICNGTLVDGGGQPAFKGDLGIRDGQIVAIGHVEGDATTTLDAEGRVVCPGFIDLHTHYDAQVMWDSLL